eukprot:TRINITY_DN354_c0_g1_i1.p1 TRINITY_DN354_c0_g1~~TRINITY_DN354_c0_g1_i1.p1  ORF type:complete len:219 (-),score=74.54 TRINITY_DN354_c0_g1_i1:102-758(-)
MSAKPVRIVYWKIPGRASSPYVFLAAGGVQVVFDDEPAEKETYQSFAPFGQLPVLIDEEKGVTLAQSAAIAVYSARRAGLDAGDCSVASAQNLQFIELEAELTQFVSKALYHKGTPAEVQEAWADALKKVVVKLERVAKMLSSPWLSHATSPSAADYAFGTTFWLLSQPALWPELAGQFPTLADHFKRLQAHSPAAAAAWKEMEGWEVYYKRPVTTAN